MLARQLEFKTLPYDPMVHDKKGDEKKVLFAYTPFNHYRIAPMRRHPKIFDVLISNDLEQFETFEDIELAKEFCQKDFDKRVSGCVLLKDAEWKPADEAPRGIRAFIRSRQGIMDYVYKTNNGEPFLETWRYAGTANNGQQAFWPDEYIDIDVLLKATPSAIIKEWIEKHLEKPSTLPKPVSDMTAEEHEIFKIASHHLGFIKFLQTTLKG